MKQIGEKRTRLRPDWWLLVAVIALTAFGIIMVFSASQYFAAYEPYNDAYKFCCKYSACYIYMASKQRDII